MEVSKVPPADGSPVRAGTTTLAEQGSQSAAPIAPAADRADIRPLDVASALTILLAEVRAGLGLPGDAATTQIPVQAARELVFLFLQRLPEDPNDVPAWTSALIHADAVFQSSIERALDVVTRWRDVPTTVVDAAKEARTLFVSALDDKPENPLWLRPEWMGLVPMLQRFRRRRRNARRRMSDPDYSSGSLDENGELPATVKEQG